jgi:tRNA pseudouridine55 synthase
MPKQYRAMFLLGCRSETDDVESAVLEVAGAPQPTRKLIDDTLPRFLGEIEQVPPAHSAVKVGGRRAYKLARAGKSVELSPRRVIIHHLEIRRYTYPNLELDIQCGSGTYVRSLGRDLAANLGTSAVMSALERTAIGEFRLEEAIALEDINPGTVDQQIQPALAAVAHLPRITISEAERIELHHGRPIRIPPHIGKPIPQTAAPNQWAAVSVDGRLSAILREGDCGELWPTLNFDAFA